MRDSYRCRAWAQFIGSTGNSDFLTVIKGLDVGLSCKAALIESIQSVRLLPQMRNTMLTATFPTALTELKPLGAAPSLVRANPETSFAMYSRYRDTALALIDTNSPQLFYRVFENEPLSYNGEALHEKFIYQGKSILDISVGNPDFPWQAADANPLCEITQQQLHELALLETDPLIAHRLQILSNFSTTLLAPPFTRYYHYVGLDGTRALTISDEFNAVKMNIILTYKEELLVFWEIENKPMKEGTSPRAVAGSRGVNSFFYFAALLIEYR